MLITVLVILGTDGAHPARLQGIRILCHSHFICRAAEEMLLARQKQALCGMFLRTITAMWCCAWVSVEMLSN